MLTTIYSCHHPPKADRSLTIDRSIPKTPTLKNRANLQLHQRAQVSSLAATLAKLPPHFSPDEGHKPTNDQAKTQIQRRWRSYRRQVTNVYVDTAITTGPGASKQLTSTRTHSAKSVNTRQSTHEPQHHISRPPNQPTTRHRYPQNSTQLTTTQLTTSQGHAAGRHQINAENHPTALN